MWKVKFEFTQMEFKKETDLGLPACDPHQEQCWVLLEVWRGAPSAKLPPKSLAARPLGEGLSSTYLGLGRGWRGRRNPCLLSGSVRTMQPYFKWCDRKGARSWKMTLP